MAQTKRKRRSKHRGNAAGMVETRGRTGKTSGERPGQGKGGRGQSAQNRADRPPSWKAATTRAAITAALFVPLIVFLLHRAITSALILGVIMFVVYIPLGYYTDVFVYRRRMARKARTGR